MPFKKFDKVIASRDIVEDDVSGNGDLKTVVIRRLHPGMIDDVMTEDATMYNVDFIGWGTLWVPEQYVTNPPTVTHVAKRRSTLFDSYNTMNRKIIGEARELYRAEVLETQVDPVSGESYHRIKIHDGAFAEVEYAGEIWTRAWQWVKVKNTQVNQFGEFNKEGFQ